VIHFRDLTQPEREYLFVTLRDVLERYTFSREEMMHPGLVATAVHDAVVMAQNTRAYRIIALQRLHYNLFAFAPDSHNDHVVEKLRRYKDEMRLSMQAPTNTDMSKQRGPLGWESVVPEKLEITVEELHDSLMLLYPEIADGQGRSFYLQPEGRPFTLAPSDEQSEASEKISISHFLTGLQQDDNDFGKQSTYTFQGFHQSNSDLSDISGTKETVNFGREADPFEAEDDSPPRVMMQDDGTLESLLGWSVQAERNHGELRHRRTEELIAENMELRTELDRMREIERKREEEQERGVFNNRYLNPPATPSVRRYADTVNINSNINSKIMHKKISEDLATPSTVTAQASDPVEVPTVVPHQHTNSGGTPSSCSSNKGHWLTSSWQSLTRRLTPKGGSARSTSPSPSDDIIRGRVREAATHASAATMQTQHHKIPAREGTGSSHRASSSGAQRQETREATAETAKEADWLPQICPPSLETEGAPRTSQVISRMRSQITHLSLEETPDGPSPQTTGTAAASLSPPVPLAIPAAKPVREVDGDHSPISLGSVGGLGEDEGPFRREASFPPPFMAAMKVADTSFWEVKQTTHV